MVADTPQIALAEAIMALKRSDTWNLRQIQYVINQTAVATRTA